MEKETACNTGERYMKTNTKNIALTLIFNVQETVPF